MPPVKKLKFGRKVNRSNKDVDISDELYDKLSYGQQTLVCLAELYNFKVRLAEYQGRNFVANSTLDEIWKELGG
jgi:hypothetical protein